MLRHSVPVYHNEGRGRGSSVLMPASSCSVLAAAVDAATCVLLQDLCVLR